jgi:serine/threonine protein kinase
MENAPLAMEGEGMAAALQDERARLQQYEALLELSGRKQRDGEKRGAAQAELQALQKRQGGLQLEGKKIEVALLVMEAVGPKPGGGEDAQECEGCEECPATVHCSNCGVSLCAKCDASEHQTKISQRHTRIALGGGGGSGGGAGGGGGGAGGGGGDGGGARPLEEVRADLRRTARVVDKCKRSLAALAHPHFPELSTSALGRLIDCDLLVERELQRDYEIIGAPLSEGQGRSTVLKARLLGTGGDGDDAGAADDGRTGLCVLKQVPKGDLHQLMNEVLIPHKLNHPLVQRVSCVFVEGANAFIETPYCAEGDLRQWLREAQAGAGGGAVGAEAGAGAEAAGGAGASAAGGDVLPPPLSLGTARADHEIVGVMRLAFTALAYMHSQNVLHRDIKTSNMLICNGKPLLCDFGIAKMQTGQTMTAGTQGGAGATPLFAAPEVLRAFQQDQPLPNSRSSDVFSAGLVLFEAMYGEPPPKARTEPPFAMPALPCTSNQHLADLLGKLLAADPQQRPTAEEALLHPFFADARGISDAIAKRHAEALFLSSLAGTEPYPRKRVGFKVVAVELVESEALACKFDACRAGLERRGRKGAELAEQLAFVGCPAAVVGPICERGLLPVGHPRNPSRSTDPGWFGDCRQGVYVGKAGDYVLKYSNGLLPLEVGGEVRVVALRVLPGKVYRCAGVEVGCAPKTPAFDSHESPHGLEWYLPLEGQSCPVFVLTVRAVELVGTGTADDM